MEHNEFGNEEVREEGGREQIEEDPQLDTLTICEQGREEKDVIEDLAVDLCIVYKKIGKNTVISIISLQHSEKFVV